VQDLSFLGLIRQPFFSINYTCQLNWLNAARARSSLRRTGFRCARAKPCNERDPRSRALHREQCALVRTGPGSFPTVPHVGARLPHFPRRLSPPADTDGRRRCVSQLHRVRSRTRIKFRIAPARVHLNTTRSVHLVRVPVPSRVPLSREGFLDRHHHHHRYARAIGCRPFACPTTKINLSAGCLSLGKEDMLIVCIASYQLWENAWFACESSRSRRVTERNPRYVIYVTYIYYESRDCGNWRELRWVTRYCQQDMCKVCSGRHYYRYLCQFLLLRLINDEEIE